MNFRTFKERLLTAIVIGAIVLSIFFLQSSLLFTVCMLLLFILCVLQEIPYVSRSIAEFGIITLLVALSLSTLCFWYTQPLQRWLVFYIIGCSFTHDTAAYLGGSLFGKHQLFPSTSPGKTWEGLVSGIGALLVLHYSLGFSHWLWSTLSVGFIATFGDWIESMLKRRAGIKDIGSLLPGHGGLLDRCDSIIAITLSIMLLKFVLIIISIVY